jgi:hypothetical protein
LKTEYWICLYSQAVITLSSGDMKNGRVNLSITRYTLRFLCRRFISDDDYDDEDEG